MEKRQKLESIEKMIRELEDIKNSQTSLLKKLAQLETENMNAGVDMLDKDLGELHEQTDTQLTHLTQLTERLTEFRDDFVKKNKLDVVEEVQ